MRRFFVGILVTLGSIALLSIVAGSALLYWFMQREDGIDLPEQFVLEIDLRSTMPLAAIAGPVAFLDESALGLDDLILKLRAAETDPRVMGLLIRIAETDHGFARAQEIRDAIYRLDAAGKPTAAWADSFGELTPGNEGYYIAATSARVAMQPGGYLGLTGVAFEFPFVRGLLDKIGIEPVVFRRSAYKTALDSVTHAGLSDANAEMLGDLSLEIFTQLVEGIAGDRDLSEVAVRAAIDQAPLAASQALQSGLIDSLAYWPEFRDDFLQGQPEGTEYVDLAAYDRQFGDSDDDARTIIGIISSEGGIVRGSGGLHDGIAADTLTDIFREARESDADAIVLRIDSGGGSAVASETIAFELRQLIASGKPIIVSMVNAAASGGYWIAAEGTRILASPGTFTGSIGVIAGKPVLAELMQNLDVQVEGAAHGRFARLWSLAKELEPFEAAKIDRTVGEVYDSFKAHVAKTRDIQLESVEELAQGRVWLGAQAVELALVDRLGGLNEALEEALSQLDKDQDSPVFLERFPREQDWTEILTELAERPFGLGLGWLTGLLEEPPGMLRMGLEPSLR